MAGPLSELQVFSEYAYSTFSESLSYQVNLFNQATRGGIILRGAAHQGDFSDTAIWAKIQGLVRRRDAYGEGAVAEKVLQQLLDTSVKVAAGTPPVRIDPGMLRWIQKSPEEAGAVVGSQLAVDTLADMLGVGLRAFIAAVGAVADVTHDATAGTASLMALLEGSGKFGDRSDDILCWVMHSKSLLDIHKGSLTNKETLFQFGNVKVMSDGFGRPFVVTDAPALIDTTPDPDQYRVCGLAGAAILIDQNNDYDDNIQKINGDENIKRTFQAEWSYNVGLKGFRWDKATGGKSPDDTELATAGNWDKYVTSFKDLAGVLVKVL